MTIYCSHWVMIRSNIGSQGPGHVFGTIFSTSRPPYGWLVMSSIKNRLCLARCLGRSRRRTTYATHCSSTLIIQGCKSFRVYLSMMVGSESVSKNWKEYVHFGTCPASYHYQLTPVHDFPVLISSLCENGNIYPHVQNKSGALGDT